MAGGGAAGGAGAEQRSRNIRFNASDRQYGGLARNPANRAESRPGQTEPDQDQAADRIPYLAVRAGAGCPPHRGWPTGRRNIRGNAQIESLGGHRPLSRRHRGRGQGVRPYPAEEDTQRPYASPRTASCTSPSRIGCWNMPLPNSSMKAPTSSLVPWSRKAI